MATLNVGMKKEYTSLPMVLRYAKPSCSLKHDLLIFAKSFGRICEHVAQEAHDRGLIKSGKVERTIDVDEANKATPHGAVLWGTNAVYVSTKGQKLLNWQPSAPALLDSITEMVELEAKSLGKTV